MARASAACPTREVEWDRNYLFLGFLVVSLPAGEVGFGRAVSRFLSAPLRTERIICLSSQYPKPVLLAQTLGRAAPSGFLFGLAPDGVFRAASLALRAVRSYRTFSPLPPACAGGGLIFCGTFRRKVFQLSARVYLRQNRSYVASRPTVFGLSSPGLRRKRFSALPKSG